MNIIPIINEIFTISECSFNAIGYLPERHFRELKALGSKWRVRLGAVQMAAGAAFYLLGRLLLQPGHGSYLSLPQQMMALGLLYANHGAFNILRAKLAAYDSLDIGLVYDFYGRKLLLPLSTTCDLQARLFERIKMVLDRIYFITLFPPQFLIKQY
jgi:hypothetical protein